MHKMAMRIPWSYPPYLYAITHHRPVDSLVIGQKLLWGVCLLRDTGFVLPFFKVNAH